MKISIAMATYNGEKYLQEQLDSFANQTRLPDELVVSDDCSSDRTMQIILDFAKQAPFEVILNQNKENLGYAGNFNNALELTTGDLVFLSDQDDVWFPKKIEHIEKKACENPDYLFIIHDGELIDEYGNKLGLTKLRQRIASGGRSDLYFTGCCAAVRKELLEIGLPIPHTVKQHDIWLGMLSKSFDKRLLITNTFQYIRRHPQNASTGIDKNTKQNTRLNSFFYRAFGVINSVKKKHVRYESIIGLYGLLINRIEHSNYKNFREAYFDTERAKGALSNELSYYEYRQKIIKKARFLRLYPIMKFWLQGGYNKFYGINSALRDIIFK